MYKLGLEKEMEPEIKLPASVGSQGKQENPRKTFNSTSLTTLKSLTLWIRTNWEILQEMGIPDHFTCSLRILCIGQEVTGPDMKQGSGSQLGEEYDKAVHHHPACLTSMQSTPC